ncbi:hypothetical protein ACFLRC_02975 [Candidatus Altiarchaeota archaeon]
MRYTLVLSILLIASTVFLGGCASERNELVNTTEENKYQSDQVKQELLDLLDTQKPPPVYSIIYSESGGKHAYQSKEAYLTMSADDILIYFNATTKFKYYASDPPCRICDFSYDLFNYVDDCFCIHPPLEECLDVMSQKKNYTGNQTLECVEEINISSWWTFAKTIEEAKRKWSQLESITKKNDCFYHSVPAKNPYDYANYSICFKDELVSETRYKTGWSNSHWQLLPPDERGRRWLENQPQPKRITFAECEEIGGTAWNVDVFHPDICPSCTEYQKCEAKYNDYSNICPGCGKPCEDCQNKYSLYESCPECYGPCQECQNKYPHRFENDEERHRLCPNCKKCDDCWAELNKNIINCPPCLSCNKCKEENKRYSDIRDVCPSANPCFKCMDKNSPYSDKCPDGMKKVAEISDAAIWFQCCK